MSFNIKEKLVATVIHFFITLLVVGLILLFLNQLWFPAPLMNLGGIQGMKLILMVDLVLGPLCTLVVFNKKKKSIFWDMTVIAALQVAAITFGMINIHTQKPAFMLVSYEEIYVVSASEKETYIGEEAFSLLEKLIENTARYEGRIPVFLLDEPGDINGRDKLNFEFEFTQSIPVEFDVSRYKEIADLRSVIKSRYALDDANSCYTLNISSAHSSTDACVITDINKMTLH